MVTLLGAVYSFEFTLYKLTGEHSSSTELDDGCLAQLDLLSAQNFSLTGSKVASFGSTEQNLERGACVFFDVRKI